MFAARDQENLVYAHQNTATSKPLNHNTKSLQPKTPALKSTFQAVRNDENVPIKAQKSALTNGLSKLDKSAFVTPAPKTGRAPLGAKTTNVKARLQVAPFKTPAPTQHVEQQGQKAPRSSTIRRSARKIHVASSEPVLSDVLDTEIEAENDCDKEPDFSTPRPFVQDLPDPPIEFTYNQDFPQFKPENLYNGLYELHMASPTDENGFSIRQKKADDAYAKMISNQVEEYNRMISSGELPKATDIMSDSEEEARLRGIPYVKITKIDSKPKHSVSESKVDSIRARSAVGALSSKISTTATLPHKSNHNRGPSAVTKQTASSVMKQKNPKSISRRPLSVSRNTIGFPPAKKPLSIIPAYQTGTVSDDGSDDNDADRSLVDLMDDLQFEPLDVGFQLPVPEE